MNKESAISRINKLGKTGKVLSNICIICIIIGIVCSLLGTVVFMALPKDLFSITLDGTAVIEIRSDDIGESESQDGETGFFNSGSLNINGDQYVPSDTSVSGDTLYLSYDKSTARVTSERLLFTLITALVYMVVCLILLFCVRRLCKALETAVTPFEETVIAGIKRCAWTLIPWAVIGGFLRNVINTLFSTTMTSGFDFNLATVLVIVLLFGLAYIFRYGAMLQNESDETL